MAITPEQAAQLLPNHQAEADAWEAEIDQRIQAHYTKDSASSLTFGVQGKHAKVVAEIFRRYTEAGWDVRRTDDQREGSFLTFTPRSRR